MIVLLVFAFIILAYYYGTKNYNYWSERGVKHNKPVPFFGNNLKHYLQKASMGEMATELYNQFPNEKVAGFYRGLTPELLIRDPDIIKHVLAVDFQKFHVRGAGRNTEVEPMLKNLFHGEGDVWKLLRQRLTPAFTSGKLKNMFHLIVECAEQLQSVVEKIAEKGEPCDMREVVARFTTDFIGACGFGIKMNSMNDENSHFRKLGKKFFKFTLIDAWKIGLKENFPNFFYNLKPFNQVLEDNILDLVKTVMEQRNYKPVGRNDFIDLMLELREQGTIVGDSIDKKDANGYPLKVKEEFDLKLMAAQAFIFFVAGFETSSSSSSYTLHELAYNPEIQKEVQDEIDTVMSKYTNKLSYEAIKEMTLLECAFKEGLRKFPALGVLNRECVQKYKFPGTEITIDKGVKIIIPVSAIQNDDKYFENAQEFNPKRFLPENRNRIHNYSYLPFGEGPRQCIGTRLGLMQSMAGLAVILHKFSVEPVPGGKRDLQLDHSARLSQLLVGGVPLVLKKRTS